jgi:hypothetical protein
MQDYAQGMKLLPWLLRIIMVVAIKLTLRCMRLLKVSLNVSRGFFCLLVFMYHIVLLSKVSTLPLFFPNMPFLKTKMRMMLFSYFVAAFVNCVAFRMVSVVMNRYKWLISNDMFQWTKGVQPFYGTGPHPLLWVGSWVARGKITSGMREQLNYCGLCLRVGDPCRKWNCGLNQSLDTLLLLRTPPVSVVSVAVL